MTRRLSTPRRHLLSVALLSGFALSACGGGSSGDGSTISNSTSAGTDASAAAAGTDATAAATTPTTSTDTSTAAVSATDAASMSEAERVRRRNASGGSKTSTTSTSTTTVPTTTTDTTSATTTTASTTPATTTTTTTNTPANTTSGTTSGTGSGTTSTGATTSTTTASTGTASTGSTSATTPSSVATPTDGRCASVSAATCALSVTMAHGINMGNMLEAPLEGDWGPAFDDSWPALIKAAGFTTVRLPIRWSNHAAVTADATLDTTFLARIDHVLATLQASGLNVILDMHHYRQLDGDSLDVHEVAVDPSVVQTRAVNIWKQVAAHYASQPASVIFGLYNEPHGIQEPTGSAPWNAFYPKLLAQVRATNPTRTVVMGSAWWNGYQGLAAFTAPSDPNVIIELHNYEPLPFSSQGTYGTVYPLNTAFDATTMTLPFTTSLDAALAWGQAHGHPIFVGEWGSNVAAPAASRVAYAAMGRAALQSRQMPWTTWNFDSDFAVYDTNANAWNSALLKALAP